MNKTLLAVLLAGVSLAAQAQLNKCVGADGKVSYSDRECPKAAATSQVKIYNDEPTAREHLHARLRAIKEASDADRAELERKLQEARAPRAAGLGSGNAPVQAREAHPQSGTVDADRCAGVRLDMRVERRMDPMGYDHSVKAHDLRRAESRYCGN